MMVNNFEKIKGLLNFTSKNDFYFLQVIQRRKENPNINRSERLIRSFYIYSIEQFERSMPFIIELCDAFNARAYISLNKKDCHKVATTTMVNVAELINNGNYHAVKNAYDSACGTYKGENLTWVVDIDTKDVSFADEMRKLIENCEPKDRQTIVAEIPTKNGIHFITRPFNRAQFSKATTEDITIHTNSPTLLYIKA